MWVAHEVRVHFGSEKKKRADVGKPFGIHELLRLVAKVDEDACQNPRQENKRLILWLGAKSCPGFLRHEVRGRCQGGLQLHNGKEHSWLVPRPQAEISSEYKVQPILWWS